jgi:hypothetical protein
MQTLRCGKLEHTYRLEGCDLGRLGELVQTILHVVDGHTTVHAIETRVRDLGYALVSAVLSLEIAGLRISTISSSLGEKSSQDGSPVVAEVLAELAGCACGLSGHILCWVHSDVQGVLYPASASKI